jgi:hypothetical protein
VNELLAASVIGRKLSPELVAELFGSIDPRNVFQQQSFLEVLRKHGAIRGAVKKRQPLVSRAPSKPNGRSRMWTSMRISRVFTAQDIASSSETHVRSVRQYINALIQARYVKVERETTFEVGDFTSYRLLVNKGPHAPRLRADGKSLLDLNLPQGEQEVALGDA